MKRKRKFTLLELLIVIAVISMLAAMLLPALNQARQIATRTVCMSSQKQLGLLFLHYTDIYKNLPISYKIIDGVDYRWTVLIGVFAADGYASFNYWEIKYDAKGNEKLPKVFHCPSAEKKVGAGIVCIPQSVSYEHITQPSKRGLVCDVSSSPIGPAFTDHSGYSTIGGGWTTFPGASGLAVKRLGKVVSTNATQKERNEIMNGRHANCINTLFLDLHAESIPVETVYQEYYVKRCSGALFSSSSDKLTQ